MRKLTKWSRKFENCVSCGTNEIKHAGRGLCHRCYNRDIEDKLKSHKRAYGVAKKRLTKDFLIEEYLRKEKSLNDIAKECCCTRQNVYKKIKQFKIPTRSPKLARDLAIKKGKCEFYRIQDDGQKQLIRLVKSDFKEDFFFFLVVRNGICIRCYFY